MQRIKLGFPTRVELGLILFAGIGLLTAQTTKTAPVPDGSFGPTLEKNLKPPSQAPLGMVWIPGGEFSMGLEDPTRSFCGSEPMLDARPIHRVEVDGFWMDRTDVTNEQFAAFVKATGYVTVAERKPRAEDFPGAPPEALVPGSLVFTPTPTEVKLNDYTQWWRYQPGANWRHPQGPESNDSRERKNTRSSRSRLRTPKSMPNGLKPNACQPKPNGNSRRAVAWPENAIPGATT